MYNKKQINSKKVIVVSLCVVLLIALGLIAFKTPILKLLYSDYNAPTPIVSSALESGSNLITQGDIYVSKNGSDANDGSKEYPFLTIERALLAVELADKTKKSEIVVCIEAGVYNIGSINLSEKHGGTADCRIIYSACGEDEVVLHSGITIDPCDFIKSKEYPEIEKRLSVSARENVYVLDLTKAPYNLTQNNWGKLYPIGTYNTADRYNGDTTGAMYSELFINGTRQNLARYPNTDYIYTDSVVSSGKTLSNKSNQDPAGDVYCVNEELSSRIESWGNIEDVWMYGFWQYDWADGSTPI